MKKIVTTLILISVLLACRKEETQQAPDNTPEPMLAVPPGFPAPVFPEGNELSPARWALGKRLFFDEIMSVDSSVSCASCHLPQHAFSDTVAFSPGAAQRPGTRNAPTLANVAYHPYYTREGGVPTLEMQILVPIQEHNEFDFNILLIADRMKQDSDYVQSSQEAYGRAPDAFVITRSIACFERTMLSGKSRYDSWLQSGDSHVLGTDEMSGMNLFFSDRTNCSRCHEGFNFTNYQFANNGLYVDYADPGRFRLTELESDRALFKVPTLRNIAVTAPYMHDGSLATLEAVVEHYNSGGMPHPNKSSLLKPLGLSPLEKSQLVAFLKTLTDDAFLSSKKFRNE
ncbi:MAG: cytochrome-c peroxidase [Lewinellaceae bacterium]|nr:cytochrome-c peroxidase [Lewinellaceae bacterium]